MKKQLLFYFTNSKSLAIILFVYLLSLNFVNAQSPTFYTGNANAPSNSYPFNNAGGQTMQSLIAPGEFTGATFGFITKFYVQGTANVAGSWNGLTVRMGQITPTTLPTASFVPSTALTTVYSATSTSITSTAAGWLLITLQTPFLYDPSQSLVVEITQCASVGGAFSVTNVSKAGSFRRSWSPPGNCSVTYSGQAADLFNCGVDMRSAGGNDAGVTAITSPTLFCSPGIQNINATIKNFGTNQVTSVNVNWSINGNLQTPLTYTSLLDTFGGAGSTTANVNLGSFNFPATLTNIKVWTSLPNSVNDTIFVNDTASGSYQQSMAGTFTIGGTPGPTNFTSFENAISAMEFAGICGPVVFNVAPGIYNRTTAIAVSDIVGTSNINTITFDGGNKNNCILKGTIPTSPIFIIRSKHTTFKNFSVENSSITTPVGIAVTGSASKVTISNCNVRLPIWTNTSSSGFCINVSGNITGVAAMSGDSITVDSCYTVGGGYGVVMYGSSNVNANRGMVLTNSTIDSCNYMGGYISYNYNPVVINNNTFNMQGWNYGYYGLYAYYNQSSDAITPHRITNNKINNFGYYGMYIYYPMSNTTAAAPLIANNVVSSFNGGSYSGFYGIYLYNYNAACRANVYYNTVAMNGVQTSTTSSAFYNTGSTSLNVKNNIFAVYSGASTPAYFATNPVGNNINYNLYWNATNTSTGNLVYRGAFYNPTNFKTATVGGDSSYNNTPSFIRTSPLSGNYALTDGCNGYGVDLSADIATDVNGNARSLTTPNVGAYEFSGGAANNLAVTRLLNPVQPITAGAQDLSIIVKNIGNNTVYSYNASYTLNGGTPVTQLMSAKTLITCDADTAIFTSTNQITLGAINLIKAYTSGPNSLTDADASNDTIAAAYYSPLSGTYTVGGTTPDFATIAIAANALSNGVSGPVVFDIRPGTYTGQVKIEGPVLGASSANAITFKGSNKTTCIINVSISAPAFLINKASYVTVRDLTINNTGTGQSSGVGVVGSNTSNEGTGVKVINCNLNLPILSGTSNSGYGIVFTGTAGATGISAIRADSILIDSNTITGNGYGIAFYGASNSSYNKNNVFSNNVLNNINYYGAYIAYQYNPVIVDNNTINMQGQNYGYYGLYFYYNQNSTTGVSTRLTRNKINGFGGYGIYCYYSMSASTAGPTLVANNVVNGNSQNSSYPGYYGIYVYNPSANQTDVYNNTVMMSGAGTSTSYTCFYNTTSTATVVKNNIFIVTNGSYTPAYFNTSPTGNNVNYNQYWNATNPTSGNLVYRGAFYNPTNYNTNTRGGDSSFNAAPTFVSATNLAITNGCIRGVNTNGLVNNDINETPRANEPNLGAYEYQSVALDLQVEAMPYPTAPITLGAQDLAVRVRNNGGNTVTSFNVAYTLNNGTPVTQSWTGTLPSCGTTTVIFNNFNQITLGNGANNIKVYTSTPNFLTDGNPSNDTLSTTLNPPLIGTYVVGVAPSDFTSVSDAAGAIAGRGIGGSVIFNIKTGTYNGQVLLTQATGASAANTITFKSQANNADSVIIASNANYVVRFSNNANHYIFDKVSINQTNNTTSGYTLLLDNNCNFDTIRNCKISAPMYDGATVTASHYTLYTTAYTGNGLALMDNAFDGSYYGIRLYGSSRTAYHSNSIISGNTFTNFYYSPLYYIYYSVGAKVTNNTFIQPAGGTTTNYMYHYYCDSAFTYTNNVWQGNSSKTIYLYMYYSNNAPANKSIVANNRFSGSGTTYIYTGQTGTNNQDIVHNSFSTGNGYFYVGYVTTLQPSFRVMNNVFSATGAYAYYFSAAPSSLYMTSDYNLVSSTGTTPYFAVSARSLPVMRTTYLGLERNSVNYRSAFTSATNLTPNAADSAVWAINGRGTHLGLALNDVNNVARPQAPAAGVPDLGAYEVTPTSIPPMATAVPATPVAGGRQAFLFGTDTVATFTYDIFSSVPTSVTVRQYTGVRNPNANPLLNYSNVYIDAVASGSGGYLFDMDLHYKPAQIGTNPTENALRISRNDISYWSTYNFNTADTVDLTAKTIKATYVSTFGQFLATDALTPLPVKLVTFIGKASNKNADLMWQTATEKNARLFEVFASVDGKNFKSIGKVNAKGNSNVTNTYTFTDVNALANNNKVYYKLKTIDVDGAFAWSEVVIVSTKNTNNTSIEVYPNPFNNNVTVSLIDNTPATIEVVNMQGVSVYNNVANAVNGFADVNLNQLANGIYFIKVTQNGTTNVQKLVKQ